MRLFLSNARQDRLAAESIAFSLRSRGQKVFLDRDDFPLTESVDQQIERSIKRSDVLFFLIFPDSLVEGRYTLTKLAFARHKWPDPNGRVLLVMFLKTPLEKVPPYLKAVTILQSSGNIPAETSAAIDQVQVERHSTPCLLIFGGALDVVLCCIIGVVLAYLLLWTSCLLPDSQPSKEVDNKYNARAELLCSGKGL